MKLLQVQLDDELKRQLDIKCATEGITLKALIVPLLEHAVNSQPVKYKGAKK